MPWKNGRRHWDALGIPLRSAALLLAAFLLVSAFAACGGDDSPDTIEDREATEPATAAPEAGEDSSQVEKEDEEREGSSSRGLATRAASGGTSDPDPTEEPGGGTSDTDPTEETPGGTSETAPTETAPTETPRRAGGVEKSSSIAAGGIIPAGWPQTARLPAGAPIITTKPSLQRESLNPSTQDHPIPAGSKPMAPSPAGAATTMINPRHPPGSSCRSAPVWPFLRGDSRRLRHLLGQRYGRPVHIARWGIPFRQCGT